MGNKMESLCSWRCRLVVVVALLILLGQMTGWVGLLLAFLAYQGSLLWQELLYLGKAALVWTVHRLQIKDLAFTALLEEENKEEQEEEEEDNDGQPKMEDVDLLPQRRTDSCQQDLARASFIFAADKLTWLNNIIRILWKRVVVEVVSTSQAESMLNQILTNMKKDGKSTTAVQILERIQIDKVAIGDVPIQVTGIKVHPDDPQKVVLDVGVSYPGDSDFSLRFQSPMGPVTIRGNELQLAFSLRVILGPFYRDIPKPSILSVQLLETPVLTGGGIWKPPTALLQFVLGSVLTDFLTVPRGVSSYTLYAQDGEQHLPVLPEIAGLVRVFLLSGRDIAATDRTLGQFIGLKGGSCDPYCVLSLQRLNKKSKVIEKSLAPEWNTYCEFPVMATGGDRCAIVVSVMDADLVGRDETTGEASIDIESLDPGGEVSDFWIRVNTENVETGEIRLRLQWVAWSPECPGDRQLQEPCAQGVLVVKLDSLEVSKQIVPLLTLRVGNSAEYSTAQGMPSLFWEFQEGVRILVSDWRSQWLLLTAYDCTKPSKLKLSFRGLSNLVVATQREFKAQLSHKKEKEILFPVVGSIRLPVRDFLTTREMALQLKPVDEIQSRVTFSGRLHFFSQPVNSIFPTS